MLKDEPKVNKLRRVILSPTKYLVLDYMHSEVRLFERHNKKNVFIRSMRI